MLTLPIPDFDVASDVQMATYRICLICCIVCCKWAVFSFSGFKRVSIGSVHVSLLVMMVVDVKLESRCVIETFSCEASNKSKT